MRLARFELRRFLRGRLTAAALVVLAVIPLLYGALYLAAFWDPYGNLDRIPVALVNEDRPVQAPTGEVVHAGQARGRCGHPHFRSARGYQVPRGHDTSAAQDGDGESCDTGRPGPPHLRGTSGC